MFPKWLVSDVKVNKTQSVLDWLISVLRSEQPDWTFCTNGSESEKIIKKCVEEGVLGLLFHSISIMESWNVLPATFQEAVSEKIKSEVARELFRLSELKKILEKLNDNNIDYLLIKGVPLAYTIYHQPCYRPHCDTDILFRSNEMAEKAYQVFEQLGYRKHNTPDGKYVSYQFSCLKSSVGNDVFALDLHWKISNRIYFSNTLSFDELMSQAVAAPALGKGAYAPNYIHSMLIACMHRIANMPEGNANRLIWLYDIHLMSDSFTQDQWGKVVSTSRDKGISSVVLDGLRESHRILYTEIPKETIYQLTLDSTKSEKNLICDGALKQFLYLDLLALPRWNDRLLLIREHLFPSAGYMRTKYQLRRNWVLPFLYCYRILNNIKNRAFRRVSDMF